MPDTIIQLEQLTKPYGTGPNAFEALRGIDATIEVGDFVAIMGASGSGKSTAMNIIGCIDTPTTGRFRFMGREVQNFSRERRALLRRRYLGFVFQGFNLLPRTTALENVALPLLYRGMSRVKRRRAAMEALDMVGLVPWSEHTTSELSGGQQQRVAIARALVSDPALLLADEPTGNLDSERSAEVMELLTALNQEKGVTILMVTHELAMTAYARTIITLKDGLVNSIKTT